MRLFNLFGIIFLLLVAQSFAIEIGSNINTVRILSVSTVVNQENYERKGSIQGGTKIYIKAVGHDTSNASNNQVFVGPYICEIPDVGVNEVFITCVTTPAYDQTKLYQQPVVIKTVNRSDSQCAQNDQNLCTFSYDGGKTPILDIVIPRVVTSNDKILWWGNFRITNTAQIQKLTIGEQNCDRSYISLNEKSSFNGNDYNSLECKISSQLSAGFYQTKYSSAQGNSVKRSKLTTIRSTDLTTQYEIQVSSSQQNSAEKFFISSRGGFVQLQVSGIPLHGDKTTFEFAGQPATFSRTVKDGKIEVLLPPGLTNPPVDNNILQYISGSGVRLQEYQTSSWDLNSLIQQLKTSPMTASDDRIIPTTEYSFSTEEEGLGRRLYVFTGYFNPPRDGPYAFQTSCSSQAQVFFQTTGDSTDESTMTMLNQVNDRTGLRQPYSNRFDLQQTTSDGVILSDLQKGKEYFFKIYSLSNDEKKFYHSTGVRIPTGNNQQYINSVTQITRIRIDYDFTREIIEIKHTDKNSNTISDFLIHFIVPYGTKLKEDSTVWQKTSTKFNKDSDCNAMSTHFKNYNGARNACVFTDLKDGSGKKIGRVWKITFDQHRTIIIPTFEYDQNLANSPTYTQIRPPGVSLSGTFRLKVNSEYVKVNKSSDISYDVGDYDLKMAIASILGTNNIDSSRVNYFVDGADWVIDFYGVGSSVLVEVVYGESKLIAEPGKVNIQIKNLRECSNQLYYSAIENELLTQKSTTPCLLIKVNGVLSLATANQSTITISNDADAFSFTDFIDDEINEILTINGVSSTQVSSINQSNFSVFYNGIQLEILEFTNSILKAKYPYKTAGSYKPEVHYMNQGFAINNAANKDTFPVISSLSSSTIYSFGGCDIIISGKYFPTENNSNLIVTIGSVQSTILSVSNTSITIRTPGGLSVGSQDIIVTFNNLPSVAQSIIVDDTDAITLTGIDNQLVSPVEKTLINVTGTKFGNDKTLLAAYLDIDENDSNGNIITVTKYKVNIVNAVDSQLQILLGGGAPGNYKLRIVQIGKGSNNPANAINQIQYNIIISSFSMDTCSKFGGSKLTIIGQNFSPTLNDNQVLITYSQVNSEFCVINSATKTKIECTLPNMSVHFPSGDTKATYKVEVWGKLIAQAIIDPNTNLVPQITFDNSYSLSISSVSDIWQGFDQVYTINGINIPTANNAFKVIILGHEDLTITINSMTSTSVKYVTPNLPYGAYQLVLRSEFGDSKAISFNIYESVYNLNNYNVSSAGQEITVKMSGNLPDQDPIFKFNKIAAETISYNPQNGQVKIRLPVSSIANGVKLLSARSALIPLNNNGNIPWTTHYNSFKVIAATWTVSSIQVSGTDITIQGTNINKLVSAYIQDPNSSKSTQYASTSINLISSTSATIQFSNAPAGTYKLFLLNNNNEYPQISNSIVQINLPDLTVSGNTSSFAGGQQITITGSRFNVVDLNKNIVSLCGNQAKVISADLTTLIVLTPPAYTKQSISTYKFLSDQQNPLSGYIAFGNDSQGGFNYIGDGDLLFYYSSSISGSCYTGLDFGETRVLLSKIDLYPRSQGVTEASLFFGTKFQASNDNTNWIDLFEIGSDFHLGKNTYLIDNLYKQSLDTKYKDGYRYFRIYDNAGNSKCQLVEIKIYGWKSSEIVESGNNLTCPISVQVNGSVVKQTAQTIIYDTSITYSIQDVHPTYGDVSGGTNITINLDKVVSGVVTVQIGGVDCTNIQISGSSVTCTTGSNSSPNSSSLILKVDSQLAVNNGFNFYYGNLWSLDATWGGDFPPIDGDVVVVNQGKTLIVDVAYVGILNTVVVDGGSLIFIDKDIHFESQNILVRNGNIIIGTEAAPITKNIRITMHGKVEDKQFPIVGNKGLSIFNGQLDIHGKKRSVVWTELSQTADVDQTEIEVFIQDPNFDWAIGEEIIISSTDFYHGHSERRIIEQISVDANTGTAKISFKQKLICKHVSLKEDYSGKIVQMRAEVGLLTRNIVFEGDNSSIKNSYGAHLMLHGSSTSARIKYAEFKNNGQPNIMGRYPIHFHMVGDVFESIVEGNSIHDSFARAIAIHATHYLKVKNNVVYNCQGHNIFLEDGIETNNQISDNLVIGTRQIWSMLQSDITPASFWITNPLNYVYNNRAAGGDFYGFLYDIKERPDGPSARSDICPQGMGLGSFKDNIAHSYDRFGLRVYVLTHLKYPCQPYRNDANPNPFEQNPSTEIKFESFISYKNHEDGVLAEEVGNMIFDNFQLIDNKQSGFNIFLTNRTDEEVVLQNSLVVGRSSGNAALISELVNTRGIITPRTDGFKVQNVHFENFVNDMTVFKTCSACYNFKKWNQGGKLTRFKQITYANISSKLIFWEKWKREIFEDIDGTLTGQNGSRWVTPSGVHIKDQPECSTSAQDNLNWDDGVICSRQVVRIEFTNPVKRDDFSSKSLFVQPTNNNGVPIQQDLSKLQSSDFYISKSIQIYNTANDVQNGFVGTFLVGKIFSIQWELTGIDFTHMSVQFSPYHTGSTVDDTIVLRFPYNEYRETFEIFRMIANKNVYYYYNVTQDQDPQQLTKIKSRDCKHGDWFNDISTKTMYLCLNENGRQKSTNNQYLERTEVNGLKCMKSCPLPPGKCMKDNIPRKMSDITTWMNKIEDGEVYNKADDKDLIIPCPWEVLVDIDITTFSRIIVQGTLRIDPSQDINIKAFGIFIRGGTIIAEGPTEGSAYTKNLNFLLLGDRKTNTQFVIDNTIEVGNKVILNTGQFILRGSPPSSTNTRLTSSLDPGSNTIQVSNTNGWQIGDKIAIAPTQFSGEQDEQFIITAIDGNTVTLNNNAKYYHFGASGVTLSETWGSYTQKLDLRAKVLHLSRNIKISGQAVNDNIQWGCRVLNYYWQVTDKDGKQLNPDQYLLLRGTVLWDGVEMDYCGQPDVVRGAIDFQNCGADKDKVVSLIKNSAIHNCPGFCANIEESAYINIQNTNFYNGRPILLRMFNVKNISVSGNHFVGARKRDYPYDKSGMLYDMNASIYFYSKQNIIADSITVSNNEIQGSEGPCVVFPHISCDSYDKQTQYGIFGNQVSSCLVGAMYQESVDGCQWAGRISVGRSNKGLMVNPNRPGIVIQYVLAAESNRSIILRFANEGMRNVGKFLDSAVYAIAITGSNEAYNSSEKGRVCSNGTGTQNLVVTRGGANFPLQVQPLQFDIIDNSEVFDAALHQNNIKYVRFQNTYSDPNLVFCKNNFMMATHPEAADATAGTYSVNVSCQDCNEEAYFNFLSSNPNWNGFFGGCGLFLCTGPKNVLNMDLTGSLFNNKPTTSISHNEGIASQYCKKQSNWNNAYSCDGSSYVQVEWESNASDYNSRSTSPVLLSSFDGSYINKLNMFREWQWNGPEPKNKRENRFLATALINTVYKVVYNGQNPANIIHRLQPRTLDENGEPNIWVIYTVTYQSQLNIEISIDGGPAVDSYLVSDNVDLTTKASICGANIYDWTTRTVQFVINGSSKCIVRAVVFDTIRLHLKVVMKVEDFFKEENKTSFISKIASFLQIDYSKIKFVGVNSQTTRFLQIQNDNNASSSFELIMDITDQPIDKPNRDPEAIYKDLTEKSYKLKSALMSNTIPGINPDTFFITKQDILVQSNTQNNTVINKDTSTNDPQIEVSTSETNNLIPIVLGVVISVVVISLAGLAFCYYKRYQKRKQLLTVHVAQLDQIIEDAPEAHQFVKVQPTSCLESSPDQIKEKVNYTQHPFNL